MSLLNAEFSILVLRLAFLALLYIFLLQLIFALRRDLRRPPATHGDKTKAAIGRLLVIASADPALLAKESIELGEQMTIGRGPHNAVVVNDSFVSANHAVLSLQDERWWIVDAGSTNGTFLNQTRVSAPAPVQFGDILEIGRAKFKLMR